MQYNDKLVALKEKYQQFFTDPTPGQILANICPYTFEIDYDTAGLSSRPLSSWDFDTELEAFALHCKKRHDLWLRHTRDLDNDYFPALAVNMGYGVHSAYFSGQEVVMGNDTSWVHPCIHEWEDMESLAMDESNLWYQKILQVAQLFVDWQQGEYAVSGFANAGPGDMANALRGNDLFMDLYDDPDRVHQLMQRCVAPIVWLERSIQRLTGDTISGSVTANCWFPGRVPYLSGDFNDLCSPDIFRAFDYQYMQQVANSFDGLYLHHHMKGFHIHRDVAKLRGLKLLEISWDPNLPRPIDNLPEIYEMHDGVPLMVRCHARDLPAALDQMKHARTVIMLNIDSLDEGREAMKLIRRHSIL